MKTRYSTILLCFFSIGNLFLSSPLNAQNTESACLKFNGLYTFYFDNEIEYTLQRPINHDPNPYYKERYYRIRITAIYFRFYEDKTFLKYYYSGFSGSSPAFIWPSRKEIWENINIGFDKKSSGTYEIIGNKIYMSIDSNKDANIPKLVGIIGQDQIKFKNLNPCKSDHVNSRGELVHNKKNWQVNYFDCESPNF